MDRRRPRISRREFVARAGAVAAAFGIVPRSALAGSGLPSPSEKLNIAFVGIGGRGAANLDGLKGENVVALCDVDLRHADGSFKKFPGAKQYRDFRKMLDEMDRSIDAVAVSTPDHTHAVAAMAAIKRGKHVYCEKPLAHSIREVRELMKAARERKVVTQLGNQGHSFEDIRRFCEWIRDGAIGSVHTVHAATGANYSKIRQLSRLGEVRQAPPTLEWDLWLGPAQARPYQPFYLPGAWRGWMAFGCGAIGDWLCHVVDPVFWALELGAPRTIVAQADGYDPKKHAETFPPGAAIEFGFPARGRRGPVTLVWHDGAKKLPRPDGLEEGKKPPDTGAIVLGDKGGILYGSHGAGGVRLFPDEKMKAYKQPEKSIPRVKDHYSDWLEAIRKGGRAGSDFDYGGPLTELALLGIIATRMPGTKLEWDGEKMRFANCDEANRFIAPAFREGWNL